MKLNYLVIPLFTIAVAAIGSFFTNQGLKGWYQSIRLPSWTPPGSTIGLVWTILFILATVAALIVWNKLPHDQSFWLVISIFVANGILNYLWSYLFFASHQLKLAIFEAGLLGLTILALVILIWPKNKLSAALLIPYFIWVSFATYLTYSVYRLNR
ncbi:MAG: TspO/MBR family protein [Acidobacteriaceae bacterium]